MFSLTNENIAWIAGILEGEGHFSSRISKGGWYRHSIQVKMTDRDIIERLFKLTGVGYIYDLGIPKYGKKLSYLWQVNKKKDIKIILEMVLPWFGKRRKSQAKQMIPLLK